MGSQAALVSAFNLLFRELPSGVLIVGTAHDEVILEADRKDAAEVEAWAKRIMVEEIAALLPGCRSRSKARSAITAARKDESDRRTIAWG
jgi:hypothetical protein